MRDNIVFQNIRQTEGEDNNKVCRIVYNFFNTELRIPTDELQNIHIIKAHRTGIKLFQGYISYGK